MSIKPFLILLFAAIELMAFNAKVVDVIAVDTLLLSKNRKVKLVGIVAPKDNKKCMAIIKHMKKHLLNKYVEMDSDPRLLKKEDLSKRGQSPRIIINPVYVFFRCDTCGVSTTEPVFTGMEMITTHPNIHLNKMLIEQGLCRVDSIETYDKKGYFLFTQKQIEMKNKK